MPIKLGFRKRTWKVIKAIFDFITVYVFLVLISVLSVYLFLGFIALIGNEAFSNNVDFVKYLTELSFVLAGFTFLGSTLIKRKEEKITQTELDILQISYLFIIAGFFGLLIIGLNYLPQTTPIGNPVEQYDFFKNVIFPTSILISVSSFLGALNYLLFVLRIRIPRLYKKYNGTIGTKKKSWKERIKEMFGFD